MAQSGPPRVLLQHERQPTLRSWNFIFPLVASIQNGLFVEYIPSLDAVLRKPMPLDDGYFRPSEEPGLGIAWDFDKLDRYKMKV